jgi:hypothetical protein
MADKESRWSGFSDEEVLIMVAALPRDQLHRTDAGLALYHDAVLEQENRRRACMRSGISQWAHATIRRADGRWEETDVRISHFTDAMGSGTITIETPIVLRAGESLTILPGQEER